VSAGGGDPGQEVRGEPPAGRPSRACAGTPPPCLSRTPFRTPPPPPLPPSAALKLIPHASFTFAKVWLLAAKLEIRARRLDAARRILGTAVGMAPKHKLFRSYIGARAARAGARSKGRAERCARARAVSQGPTGEARLQTACLTPLAPALPAPTPSTPRPPRAGDAAGQHRPLPRAVRKVRRVGALQRDRVAQGAGRPPSAGRGASAPPHPASPVDPPPLPFPPTPTPTPTPQFAELESQLGEVSRARALYELAVGQPLLDMPEALWKGYIDFEIEQVGGVAVAGCDR
jgi:hypothetical protein